MLNQKYDFFIFLKKKKVALRNYNKPQDYVNTNT